VRQTIIRLVSPPGPHGPLKLGWTQSLAPMIGSGPPGTPCTRVCPPLGAELLVSGVLLGVFASGFVGVLVTGFDGALVVGFVGVTVGVTVTGWRGTVAAGDCGAADPLELPVDAGELRVLGDVADDVCPAPAPLGDLAAVGLEVSMIVSARPAAAGTGAWSAGSVVPSTDSANGLADMTDVTGVTPEVTGVTPEDVRGTDVLSASTVGTLDVNRANTARRCDAL
jgi:hypothetical protein